MSSNEPHPLPVLPPILSPFHPCPFACIIHVCMYGVHGADLHGRNDAIGTMEHPEHPNARAKYSIHDRIFLSELLLPSSP